MRSADSLNADIRPMLEVTVPGAGPVPMASVTSTAVAATLVAACGRGEPLAGLRASEESTSERYGFAPATFDASWQVERSEADFVSAPDDDAMNRLQLVGADEVKAVWPALHERIRTDRIGEVSAYPGRWSSLTDEPSGTDGAVGFVLHRDRCGVVDGIARYRVTCSSPKETAVTAVVEACETTNPVAYSALWRVLLDLDLTNRIRAPHRPVDEPLRWMLTNPRALRVTNSAVNLCLRILDVPTALQLRSYGAEARLVLDISDDLLDHNAGRWEFEATENGASVARTSARPDVTLDISALGSMYLGGVGPAALAAAGRLHQHSDFAARRLDELFRQDPAPFSYAGF